MDQKQTLIYAGIGSRETPEQILCKMRMYGDAFADLGVTLRSGGAFGADMAFEIGCDRSDGDKEIYLPWKNYNNNSSPLVYIPIEAFEYASDVYGSSWRYLKHSVKKLMARNIQQIMGENLDTNADFVLCYTSDGCESHRKRKRTTGGTGQAIACASQLEIPVYNLGAENRERDFLSFLKETFK